MTDLRTPAGVGTDVDHRAMPAGDPLLGPPTAPRPGPARERPAQRIPDGIARRSTSRSAASTGGRGTDPRSGRWKRDTHSWARKIHVYTSMVALVIVLFFGATGLLLNHPEWTFGDEPVTTVESGTFPFDVLSTDGVVDFLAVSEHVREVHGVDGAVDDYRADESGGSISYANPGYSANVVFDVEDDTYEVTVTEEGWSAVVRDLHTGDDARSAWRWTIDVAAGFLVVIALTGLVIQLFLRKRRRPALVTALVGGAATIGMVLVTLS